MANSKFKTLNGRELIKSLKNPGSEWRSKTPMEKWCYFYSLGKLAFGLIRIPVCNDINNLHYLGYFWIVYYLVIILSSIYTMIFYFFRGEIQLGLPSTCMAFILVGNYPMAQIWISDGRFKLQSLIDFGGRYIYRDSHEKTEYNRISSEVTDNTMNEFIVKMAAIFMSYVVSLIGPTQAYLVHGIKSTTTNAHIPFTEPKSNAEFYVNFCVQSVVAAHGILCYIGLEVTSSLLENNVKIATRLVESELVETIQQYEKKSITELQLNLKMRNIVEQSSDSDK